MFAIIARILAGPILDKVFGVVERWQTKQITREEAAAEVATLLTGALTEAFKQQGKVILAEIASDSWLAKTWRPIVGLGSFFIIAWYGLFVPILVAWAGLPAPRVGDALLEWIMTLCTICIGGYVGGRSVEKITSTITAYLASRK